MPYTPFQVTYLLLLLKHISHKTHFILHPIRIPVSRRLAFLASQPQRTQRVFKQLTAKGLLSLGEITRGTGMMASMVKHALLILVQQNCVNAYLQPGEESFRGARPSFHLYEADLGRVLQIIRYH